jgi:AcrR family transcriptional regulator
METREKILQRTGELFRMMGMKSLTMDYIAADMGISKRTIYELFPDKDTLMLHSIEYMIMESNKSVLDLVRKADNVVEAIFVMIDAQRRQMMESNPVILEDLQRYFVRLQTSYYANREKCREFSVSYTLLERGIKEGIFREELKIDLVDTFILELIVMFHNSQALKQMKMTRQEALDNIFLPYFRGICTQEGLKLIEAR